jgi:hypothetical protein
MEYAMFIHHITIWYKPLHQLVIALESRKVYHILIRMYQYRRLYQGDGLF